MSVFRVHGGSFIVGSATGPGLDGSKLAIATNSIVAVMQYRLGAVRLTLSSTYLTAYIPFLAWFHGT